jgi:hypothetical protein
MGEHPASCSLEPGQGHTTLPCPFIRPAHFPFRHLCVIWGVHVRGDFSFEHYRGRVLGHRMGWFPRRRTAVAWPICRAHIRRLLRFLWWSFGPFVGWPAQHCPGSSARRGCLGGLSSGQ